MRPAFQRAEWEVARIIEAPVSGCSRILPSSSANPHTRGERPVGRRHMPYFDIDGEKVWGATAMVLAEFCAILNS